MSNQLARDMKLDGNENIILGLALVILPVLVLFKCLLWLWCKFRVAMNEASKSSSVDPPGLGVQELGAKEIVKETRVRVELINGECHVKNGDEKLTARCNAVLAEMNAFQIEFLTRVPQGKPNEMLFTEVILRDENGCIEKKAYFEKVKEKDGMVTKLYKKLKSAF